jgi:hypothetical protein
MSHFAKVENGIVTQVIVVEQDVINTGAFGDPSLWVQTSYNTVAGYHPEGRPLRKNFAGIGYTYDSVRDAFYTPKPFPSWILDEQTCLWHAPIAYPADGAPSFVSSGYTTGGTKVYHWDESVVNWVETQPPSTASDTIITSNTASDTITVGTTLA